MFLNFILIGNIISLIGMSIFTLSSLAKTKKGLLIFQCISHTLTIIAQAFTTQFAGLVQDFINIVRNLFVITNKNNKIISIILITLGFTVGLSINYLFNNNDFVGYLPVFSTLIYSIIVMIPRINVIYIKSSMILTGTCWAIYSFCYLNYVMGAFNIVAICIAISQILIILLKKKK